MVIGPFVLLTFLLSCSIVFFKGINGHFPDVPDMHTSVRFLLIFSIEAFLPLELIHDFSGAPWSGSPLGLRKSAYS